jgi:hypothetical protein
MGLFGYFFHLVGSSDQDLVHEVAREFLPSDREFELDSKDGGDLYERDSGSRELAESFLGLVIQFGDRGRLL